MLKIDSHQHFWEYEPVKHGWIDDNMSVIRKNFLPADLEPLLKENDINGCIAVQADQTETETDFLLGLQKENDFIRGIVGWVDLRAENIEERLAQYKQYNAIKGFRHILQGEDPSFMLQPDFVSGRAFQIFFNKNIARNARNMFFNQGSVVGKKSYTIG